MERRHPAGPYVAVDDKLRTLTAVKQAWGRRVTTVVLSSDTKEAIQIDGK